VAEPTLEIVPESTGRASKKSRDTGSRSKSRKGSSKGTRGASRSESSRHTEEERDQAPTSEPPPVMAHGDVNDAVRPWF
jgi:hypothetical protein